MSTNFHPLPKRPFPLTPPNLADSSQAPKMSIHLPQTPQSPSQPYTASAGKASPVDSSQATNNGTLPTPAHSINGSMSALLTGPSLSIVTSPNSNKRKREMEDHGDRSRTAHAEDRELGIEDLHLDVGKKYLLCRSPHSRKLPDLSHDLIDMYSLNEISAKVARNLPNGDKNGLRKTYKGKIKDLSISGKFDVMVHEEEDGGLLAMMCVPEDEWHVQHVRGSEIEKGLTSTFQAAVSKAMTMVKGDIPKSQWDRSVLGDLEIGDKKPEKKSAASTPKASSGMATPRTASGGVTQRGISSHDIARPKRKIKQRSYGDTSFEGYGEGYVDDEAVDAGYSTGEGDDRSAQKRRKKNVQSYGQQEPSRQNSWGPGMIGA